MKFSYECSDLIEEIRQDIIEFGKDEPAWGIVVERKIKLPFTEKTETVSVLVNYLLGDEPPTAEELEGGQAELSTLGELLRLLEKQNRIL